MENILEENIVTDKLEFALLDSYEVIKKAYQENPKKWYVFIKPSQFENTCYFTDKKRLIVIKSIFGLNKYAYNNYLENS